MNKVHERWWELSIKKSKLKDAIYISTYGWKKDMTSAEELSKLNQHMNKISKEIEEIEKNRGTKDGIFIYN